MSIFQSLRIFFWKRKYKKGQVIYRFIAKDIKREFEVVDVLEIENGMIRGKVRTWNVLYVYKGLNELPPFSEVKNIRLEELWKWDGELWGGPVTDPHGTGNSSENLDEKKGD